MKVETSLYELASRLEGLKEIAGSTDNGFINWAHSLCGLGHDAGDEVPWCSSFANACAFLLGLERSKSAAARSWLSVGDPVPLEQWQRGDIAVLSRGEPPAGHVGIVKEIADGKLLLLGGNQSNTVNVTEFPLSRVLGLRRLRRA